MASRGGPGYALRHRIMKDFDFTCAVCGVVGEARRWSQGYGYYTSKPNVYLSIDHIVPRSMGGTNDPENLQVLCTECNSKKGTHSHGPGPLTNKLKARSLVKQIAVAKLAVAKLEGKLMSLWGLT